MADNGDRVPINREINVSWESRARLFPLMHQEDMEGMSGTQKSAMMEERLWSGITQTTIGRTSIQIRMITSLIGQGDFQIRGHLSIIQMERRNSRDSEGIDI